MTRTYFILICAGAVLLWELAKEARRQWLLRKPTLRSTISQLPIPGPWPSPRENSNPHPNQPRPVNFPVAPPPTEP